MRAFPHFFPVFSVALRLWKRAPAPQCNRKNPFLFNNSSVYFIDFQSFMDINCEQREHGRCAALRWLCGWALGSIGDHALFSVFIFI